MSAFSHQRIQLSPDVMARRIGKEFVILNVKRECYFGLDEVGARMFALLTEGSSIEDVLRQLELEYSADPERLRQDLEGLIGELVRHELIQIVARPEV
jgi:hypothetical protein